MVDENLQCRAACDASVGGRKSCARGDDTQLNQSDNASISVSIGFIRTDVQFARCPLRATLCRGSLGEEKFEVRVARLQDSSEWPKSLK